jgi:hypothetical protein
VHRIRRIPGEPSLLIVLVISGITIFENEVPNSIVRPRIDGIRNMSIVSNGMCAFFFVCPVTRVLTDELEVENVRSQEYEQE